MSDEGRSAELSPQEREAFASLSRERTPPGGLEDRVVEALRGRGLIRPAASRWRRRGLAAAAAAAVLAAGFLAGRWSVRDAPADAAADASQRFMLLLYETPERDASRSPEENRALAAEYGAWARELGREGRFVGGDPLHAGGRMLRRAGERVEAGSEPTAGGEIVVGYFMVRARDEDEALEIARGCPHLKYDGGVLVRRVGHT